MDRLIAMALNGGRLLAEGPTRVVSFSEPIRRGAAAEMDWHGLATALLAMVGCVLALFWLSRLGRRYLEKRRHSPAQLFLELCRVHGLNHAERKSLKRLAASHGLRQPAELFVDESRFDLRDEALESHREVILGLRRRLFAAATGPAIT